MEKKGRRSEPLVGNLKMKEDEEEKENRSQRKRRSTSDEQPSETPNKKKTPVKEAIRKMLAAKTENKINALASDLQNLRASCTPSPPPEEITCTSSPEETQTATTTTIAKGGEQMMKSQPSESKTRYSL